MNEKLTLEQISAIQRQLFDDNKSFEGVLQDDEIKKLLKGDYTSRVVHRYIGSDGRIYRRVSIAVH